MRVNLLDRPLCVYYLWKISKDFFVNSKDKNERLTKKQALGQLTAERKNLQKMNDFKLGIHILCIAYLEEKIKTSSEESFQLLLEEIHLKVNESKKE